jgi:hypothetical protein
MLPNSLAKQGGVHTNCATSRNIFIIKMICDLYIIAKKRDFVKMFCVKAEAQILARNVKSNGAAEGSTVADAQSE